MKKLKKILPVSYTHLTADDLYTVMTHTEYAPCCFTAGGKCLRQKLVELSLIHISGGCCVTGNAGQHLVGNVDISEIGLDGHIKTSLRVKAECVCPAIINTFAVYMI